MLKTTLTNCLLVLIFLGIVVFSSYRGIDQTEKKHNPSFGKCENCRYCNTHQCGNEHCPYLNFERFVADRDTLSWDVYHLDSLHFILPYAPYDELDERMDMLIGTGALIAPY